MRKIKFVNGEFYHIYNRGTDKRIIFINEQEFKRFLRSLQEFNCTRPIGSLYQNSFCDRLSGRTAKLVNIVCYCLNPNHYHLILEQVADGGVSEFMKRLSGGYTTFFNIQHKRSGVLFQGKFKAAHINSNEYLLHLSAYVNLNNRAHQLRGRTAKSSWDEYVGKERNRICKKDIVLDQFKNRGEYEVFAQSSLRDILGRKQLAKELEQALLE